LKLVKGKGKEERRGEGWRCGKEVDVDVEVDVEVDVDVDWVGGGDGAMGRWGDVTG